MGLLEERLGVTGKTLRKWRDVLVNGDWEPLAAIFHGPGADAKLRPDIEQYVRRRYRDAVEPDGKLPYGFRQEIVDQVSHFWELDISGEVLRQVFRDEDRCIERDQPAFAPAPDAAAEITTENEDRSPCPPPVQQRARLNRITASSVTLVSSYAESLMSKTSIRKGPATLEVMVASGAAAAARSAIFCFRFDGTTSPVTGSSLPRHTCLFRGAFFALSQ